MQSDRGTQPTTTVRHRRRGQIPHGRAVLTGVVVALCAGGIVLCACQQPAATGSTTRTAPGATRSTTMGAVVPGGAPISPGVTPTGRSTDGQIEVSGTVRTFRVYVPPTLERGHAVPLLVALHGGLGSGVQFEQQTGFDGLAQANRFIVVYPNGTPVRPGSDKDVWNAGACCSLAAQNRDDVNDVAFISAVITHLEQQYDIDRHRVYVTGHSNGAMLGERLACQLAGKVVAIAVQSGTLVADQCDPTAPVAVLEIHGTADTNVPIDGGVGPTGLNAEDYPPAVNGLMTLAAHDGCPGAPSHRPDGSNPAVDFEIWRPCDAGTAVVWAKVTGANHAWMGHPTSAAAERQERGSPFMGFDSSAATWSFLSAQSRP